MFFVQLKRVRLAVNGLDRQHIWYPTLDSVGSALYIHILFTSADFVSSGCRIILMKYHWYTCMQLENILRKKFQLISPVISRYHAEVVAATRRIEDWGVLFWYGILSSY